MKKYGLFLILMILALSTLTGCVIHVPNSDAAKEKLEEKGYEVECNVMAPEDHEGDFDQIVILNAFTEEGTVLQVYFFTNAEDTKRFFEDKAASLRSDVEEFHKYRYSICRGTHQAVQDFLE